MLHIRQIDLTSFATHNNSRIHLPAHGLVVVTGSNGAGKSSLLEGVATGLWNDSLRGEMGWRAGGAGKVMVTTDGLTVTRTRSKSGTSKVEWSFVHEEPVLYETASKAQTALEEVIGSYDVWRRTCVLSSMDSAAFSLARDADRKRLLEEFLGLSMFDVALDACRKDKREAAAKAQKTASECEKLNLQLSFAQSTLASAQKELDLLPSSASDLAGLKATGQRMAELVKGAEADAKDAAERVLELQKAKAEAVAQLNAEKARLARLPKDACATCGQNVTDIRSQLEQEVAHLQAEAVSKLATLEAEYQSARELEAELQEEAKSLLTKLNNLRTEFRLAEQSAKLREGLLQKVADAKAALEESAGKVKAAEDVAKSAQTVVEHLEAVEQVLGLRGVRAQVLDHSLSALEAQANAWLARMPTEQGPLTVTLSGSTTQKSGAVVDSIALRVNGRPYASCSGGERRRVDVALLLALRELAVAAHGRDGSLLCDEVFDALDTQGQADVAAALGEMAADRAVVVVTHSPELVKALKPQLHLHVSLEAGSAKIAKV